MSPPPADQERILELYERGLYLQAYQLAHAHGPLDMRRGTPAMILAGRLAMNLGGMRLGFAIHLRAARADVRSPEARYYAARALFCRQGAALAWIRMRAWGQMEDAPVELRADWLALQATVAARLHDFEMADELMRRAESLAPDRPWTCIERASLFEEQDRYTEALDAVREALRLRPWYRPAVQAAAHLLLILGRAHEARDLLSQAAAVIESGAVVAQLATLLAELRRFREGLDCLDRFEALSPLLDREGRRWLAAKRSDSLYQLGDREGARRQATLAESPFHAALAERLAKDERETRRVLLPVPFVKQHRKTCGPATLTSLAAFWGRRIDQAAVAEAICYDGTPLDRVRAWAEENGWMVREFRLTWASACALLDRGIPFALVTESALSGHLQAVVGYDACRGTLHVRCPSQPFLVEFDADALLEKQRWCGPRGLVVLPLGEAGKLAGLELPDGRAYDDLHAIRMALLAHRRYEAGAIQRRLAGAAAGHPLTLWAALYLAAYDSDPAKLLQCLNDLLRVFPGTPSLILRKLWAMRRLARPAEYARILAESCKRHPHELALRSLLAHELSFREQEHPQVRRILRTVLRSGHWPTEALNLLSLARTTEGRTRPEDRLELYRLAAHFEDRREAYAMEYFTAARSCRRTDEAVAFLHRRFEAFGRASGDPVQTLFLALEVLDRKTEALKALHKGLSFRPHDGELMLFAAEAQARCGRLDRAAELLSAARGRARQATWHRAAAALASRRGDRAVAVESWREVIAAEPSAVDAHAAVAGLLAVGKGPAAAVAHLRSVCERFPHHHALRELRIRWETRDRSRAVFSLLPLLVWALLWFVAGQ